MTEDDARTKWCPMVRQINYVGENGGNRIGHDEVSCRHSLCIASDCMMWIATDNECVPTNIDVPNGVQEKCYPAGYCGLTNKWSR